jgi:hypothetical protein
MTDRVAPPSEDRQNFELWYGTKLKPLMEDQSAGFICAMVAFPLLERYLRRKSGSEPRAKTFNEALLGILPELESVLHVDAFWSSYRHGLLHNVMLNRDMDWLSHQTGIVKVSAGKLWLNPSLFLERVVNTIRADFDIFAQDPGLPLVKAVPIQSLEPIGTPPIVTVVGTGGRR